MSFTYHQDPPPSADLAAMIRSRVVAAQKQLSQHVTSLAGDASPSVMLSDVRDTAVLLTAITTDFTEDV